MKDGRTRTVILDDELPIVNMLTRVCEGEGHVVRPFMRASEALHCLATEPIDLLITDMCMPESDGITVTEEAWRLRPDLYVLIITGHAGMFPVENLLAGGHADIMFKPFRLNEFRARLDLARRRRDHIARLTAETRALHQISRDRIQELERELEGS
jgi:DNA-binding response OmpR family regulator